MPPLLPLDPRLRWFLGEKFGPQLRSARLGRHCCTERERQKRIARYLSTTREDDCCKRSVTKSSSPAASTAKDCPIQRPERTVFSGGKGKSRQLVGATTYYRHIIVGDRTINTRFRYRFPCTHRTRRVYWLVRAA